MISCRHSILFRFRNDWVNRMARAGALGELCVSMPLTLCFKRVIPVELSCVGLQRAHETRQIIRPKWGKKWHNVCFVALFLRDNLCVEQD